MAAWQFGKAMYLQHANGWARFVSMQDHYNLLNREEEREMLPLCLDTGVGDIPWSPLARGRLARQSDGASGRSALDTVGHRLYAYADGDDEVVDAVGKVARSRGVAPATVALAWLLAQPAVTAPIVGARMVTHLTDALAAIDLDLDSDERERMTAPYRPHPVAQGA